LKKIFFLILFATSSALAKQCTLEEIRQIDTRAIGNRLSVYPIMSDVTLLSPLVAYVPRMDSSGEENSSFWTITLIGMGGWVYTGLQTFPHISCDDDLEGRRRYSPSRDDLVRYHIQQRNIFWNNYAWLALWMAGVYTTTQYEERKVGALMALVVPWTFAASKRWSAFIEESELQFVVYPDRNKKGEDAFNTAVRFTF
jgi:hypothetical protein